NCTSPNPGPRGCARRPRAGPKRRRASPPRSAASVPPSCARCCTPSPPASSAPPATAPRRADHAMSTTVLKRVTVAVPTKADRRLVTRRLAIAGAALLVALGAAWYGHDWWTVGRFIESTDDAYVGGDITVIAPKVAGFIAEVAVADNQAVHAGDLLVRLDDRDYRAALAKTEGAVAAAQAALANLDANRRLQEAVIAQAAAEVAAADAEVA